MTRPPPCVRTRSGTEFFWQGFPININYFPRRKAAALAADHRHDFTEILLFFDGAGSQVIDGATVNLSPGMVYCFNGGMVHAFRCEAGSAYANLMFDPAALPLPLAYLGGQFGFQALFGLRSQRWRRGALPHLQLSPTVMQEARALVERMAQEQRQQRPGARALLIALLSELLVLLVRAYPAEKPGRDDDALRLAGLLAEMSDRCEEAWPLQRMAEAVGLARSQFVRVFEAATGQAPHAHLLGLRFRRALDLLADPAIAIESIAWQTGFSSPSHFARQFRQRFGVSPTQWRRAQRNGR